MPIRVNKKAATSLVKGDRNMTLLILKLSLGKLFGSLGVIPGLLEGL